MNENFQDLVKKIYEKEYNQADELFESILDEKKDNVISNLKNKLDKVS